MRPPYIYSFAHGLLNSFAHGLNERAHGLIDDQFPIGLYNL